MADKALGGRVPTRFLSFCAVGAVGVLAHLQVGELLLGEGLGIDGGGFLLEVGTTRSDLDRLFVDDFVETRSNNIPELNLGFGVRKKTETLLELAFTAARSGAPSNVSGG